MPWQESYETGITSVDLQHRRLFDRIERVHTFAQKKEYSEKEREEIRDIMADLENYVAAHFTLEERLMQDNNYPQLEEHIREHEKFTEKINSLMSSLEGTLAGEDAKINEFLQDLSHFLENWLKGHILVKDFAYVPYIKSEH
ncbi:MAG: bacteriohemerythrin [Leptospiraceae bacterium]|nr:bacteriohemerythrin [Leptospiraceae bacterium]